MIIKRVKVLIILLNKKTNDEKRWYEDKALKREWKLVEREKGNLVSCF